MKEKMRKLRSIILTGGSNTGKSTLLELCLKVFGESAFSLRKNEEMFTATISKIDGSKKFLAMDEANLENFCKQTNIHNTKQLLDGTGWFPAVKGEHATVKFSGSLMCMTT
jgi:predicted ATPase